MEPKTTIRFMAEVNDQTAMAFINLVENEMKSGVKSFRVIISSPGGWVNSGISMYNYLKGIPVTVETVNFGIVDSISVIIFCAGQKRISVPNARFLIHDIFRSINGTLSLSEVQLNEWIKSLKKDRENIVKIISDTTGKSNKRIENLIKKGEVLDPVGAKEIGLVQEINKVVIEEGVKVLSIN